MMFYHSELDLNVYCMVFLIMQNYIGAPHLT